MEQNDKVIKMQQEYDLSIRQHGWLRQFDVIMKGLAYDKACKRCAGRGYEGVSFVPSRKMKTAQGDRSTEPYYSLILCSCARIPEQLDPLVLWKRIDNHTEALNQLQAQMNVLYSTTIIGAIDTLWWRIKSMVKELRERIEHGAPAKPGEPAKAEDLPAANQDTL